MESSPYRLKERVQVYIHNWRVHGPLFRVGTTPGNLSKRSHDESHDL